ncbi:nucleoside triphosphate pyrophosphohydrolase [Nitratireductor basaltis]|uniref:Nucleoside triphosphate pyrophosphohydrolase n=1 Tax=Nitratireductor basaltis TaxID=472175 RepID=A0A084UAL1_9HYPH|nr:nucleoside triphosphate pyrophosphohydrolase [Nitratireductor basaltis]KFB09997.1 Nucleoside triphosphate pyrophosphohydrolase [Nitratireductor basaltis]
MKPSRDIEGLLRIMAALRDPVSGCPWDVEQDFASIAPYTIEEAYEVDDAIRRGDMMDLAEELGDLLLQVVFHSRIAEEAGHFSFEDVVEAITRKMIRRHPHVFGDEDARQAGMAKGMWEKIKAEEKAERRARRRIAEPADAEAGYLDDVPLTLPATTVALKLQQKAARVGFDWGDAAPTLDKIEEEIGELRRAIMEGLTGDIEDELGDVIFSVVNLARHLKLDPEAALRRTNGKFKNRFHAVERALSARDQSLDEATLEEMEELWQLAKREKNPA